MKGQPFCEEWLGTFGLSSLEKERLRGDLTALCSFLRSREGGTELFSLVFHDRTHGNGSELLQGSLRMEIRKHFFMRGWSDTGAWSNTLERRSMH